jgi:putative membrane protein
VYYAASEHLVVRAQLAVMARKLYRFVTPFMIIAIALGVTMIAMNPDYYLQSKWMWAKLGGVAFLFVYHLQCGRYVYAINNNLNKRSHVFYRFFNEVPVLFLFGIVILAVIKPF